MPDTRSKRKLAAILAADVVGYSRLMEADEAGTLDRLKAARAELIDPKIDEFGGRMVKTTGDGALVEFPSAVDAVQCAVDIQRAMAEREADQPEDKRLGFRIGINLGDVIIEGDDVFGDGINVAARLETLAEPGGICLSGIVRESIGNAIDADFADAGEQTLKNIGRPIRVWHWRPSAVAPASGGKSLGGSRPSLAVLPFENMSGDPEQEYFADGLTEDLITALTHWRYFPVIARNSTFSYKGKAVNVTQAARELGASYVLEGSVRRAGDRVRVNAQLIDAATGHHIWAERFDRDMDDVFDLQDELTRRIAATLAPELSRAELQRTAAKRPSDLDAWDYCLRGDAALAKRTPEAIREACECFEQAIAIDPEYSEAYAGLAMSHICEVLFECAEDREASTEKAMAAARRAVELDPDSSRAHRELSTCYILRDQHDLALEEARLAVRLNPNDAVGLHMYGNKSDLAGDPEGVARMELAQQLNPRDVQAHVYLGYLARAYVNARRYEDAIEAARAALRRRPDYPNAHYILAIALAYLDRLDEAREALDACEKASPGFVERRADWRPYTDEDSNRHLQEGIERIPRKAS